MISDMQAAHLLPHLHGVGHWSHAAEYADDHQWYGGSSCSSIYGIYYMSPGDYSIVQGTPEGKLPLVFGIMIATVQVAGEEQGVFSWLHPLESPEFNFRPGRKKKVLDVFGPWIPANEESLAETEVLPSVMQPSSTVLVWDFEVEIEEGKDGVYIPFSVFDQCLDVHRIDCTGLSYSSTKRGNLYRTHRLMVPAC